MSMKPSFPAKSAFFCRLKSISGLLLHSREWGRGAPPLASTRPHAQAARSLLRRKGIPVAGPRAALHASRCRGGATRPQATRRRAGAALTSWRSAVRRPQRRAARRARRCVGAATDLGPGSLFHSDCESVWRPAEQTSKNTTRFLCPPPPPPNRFRWGAPEELTTAFPCRFSARWRQWPGQRAPAGAPRGPAPAGENAPQRACADVRARVAPLPPPQHAEPPPPPVRATGPCGPAVATIQGPVCRSPIPPHILHLMRRKQL